MLPSNGLLPLLPGAGLNQVTASGGMALLSLRPLQSYDGAAVTFLLLAGGLLEADYRAVAPTAEPGRPWLAQTRTVRLERPELQVVGQG